MIYNLIECTFQMYLHTNQSSEFFYKMTSFYLNKETKYIKVLGLALNSVIQQPILVIYQKE